MCACLKIYFALLIFFYVKVNSVEKIQKMQNFSDKKSFNSCL